LGIDSSIAANYSCSCIQLEFNDSNSSLKGRFRGKSAAFSMLQSRWGSKLHKNR
jgi:hypothetical protein